MSGAAALAAARRRRAGPSNNPPPPPQSINRAGGPNQLKRPEMNEPMQQAIPAKINPTMMLMNHNKIIENLQNVITNLNEKIDSETMNQIETDKLIRNIVKQSIDDLKISEDNIDFFRDKYTKMEVQLNELKKHIIKVQTFAMETNLQCIELKKKMFRENMTASKDIEKNSEMMTATDSVLVRPYIDPSRITLDENRAQMKQTNNLNEILHDETNEIV